MYQKFSIRSLGPISDERMVAQPRYSLMANAKFWSASLVWVLICIGERRVDGANLWTSPRTQASCPWRDHWCCQSHRRCRVSKASRLTVRKVAQSLCTMVMETHIWYGRGCLCVFGEQRILHRCTMRKSWTEPTWQVQFRFDSPLTEECHHGHMINPPDSDEVAAPPTK